MAKMAVVAISRKAVRKNEFRIAVTKASGDALELTTPIMKVQRDPEYRKVGKRTIPVEQYGFEVAGKTVDRFADATAIVLKRHQVQIVEGTKVPTYVEKAVKLNAA